MKKTILITFFLFTTPLLYSTHFAGGELTYEFVGNTNFPHKYEFTLTLIIDSRSTASVSSYLNISNSCGYTGNLNLSPQPGSGLGLSTWAASFGYQSPYNCVDTMGVDPDLYEIYIYKGVQNLTSCGDWLISYNNCCLSTVIENLQSPDSKNFYLEATIKTTSANNSPKFINPPFKSFCINSSHVLKWNQATIDIDGDSLYYKFINAKSGNNTPILYSPGYGPLNQISSTPPALIDSKTGVISLKPTKIENVLITIGIEEYRRNPQNQVYEMIGSIERSMQIPIVAYCANNGVFSIGADPDSVQGKVTVNCGNSVLSVYSNVHFDPYSIAADASDFALYRNNTLVPLKEVTINNIYDKKINIHLRDKVNFNDTLYLKVMMGSDFNTIISDCGNQMNAGDSLMVIFQGCSGVGIEENFNPISSVYPNPLIDFINISLNDFYNDVSIKIRDNTARVILQKSLDAQLNYHDINISHLPQGIYYLSVEFPDSIENHRIIKK